MVISRWSFKMDFLTMFNLFSGNSNLLSFFQITWFGKREPAMSIGGSQMCEAFWWRVCYQQGLPRLVFYSILDILLFCDNLNTPNPGGVREKEELGKLKIEECGWSLKVNILGKGDIREKHKGNVHLKPVQF